MPKVKKRASSEDIANVLATLAAKLPRTLRAKEDLSKLTPAESSVLAVLIHGGPMKLGRLAEYEQVTPASISRTMGILEKRGLASRSRDETDGRGAIVQATSHGARLFREGHARRLAPLIRWVDLLSPDEIGTLTSALHLLEAAAVLGSATPQRGSQRLG